MRRPRPHQFQSLTESNSMSFIEPGAHPALGRFLGVVQQLSRLVQQSITYLAAAERIIPTTIRLRGWPATGSGSR
jgi:hypothetical protein